MVSRTWKWLAALTALLGVGLPIVGAVDGKAAVGESPAHALCPDDGNKEPGIQGDVPSGADPKWDCGVHEIGFEEGAGGPMAVAGHCAYTGGGGGANATPEKDGVRVIDVSDPTDPEVVKVLDTGSRELLAAEVSPDGKRAMLATRHRDTVQREGQVRGRDMLIDIWDIRNCTDPVKLNTVVFPTQSKTFGDPQELGGPAHNLKFNPSVTKLYGTMPLHEVDLTTWEVRDLQCTIASQYHETFVAVPGLCSTFGQVDHPFGTLANQPTLGHEPTFSPDGSRLYLGGQQSHQQNGNAMLVVDMTTLPDPTVLSITQEAPGHSIDFITVNGREYLLHSNEIANTSCVHESVRPRTLGFGDRAFILDVTRDDETEEAPVKISELLLEDSKFAYCGHINTDGRPSINTGGPTIAYHDVDDALDSSYAVLNLGPAGFRFFDIRNPEQPVEVAYFNWGASEHTKSYIIPATGHIWVSDADGFRVLELEPQVISHLGLAPPSKAACENGGWNVYRGENDQAFKNEGDCISYVARRNN